MRVDVAKIRTTLGEAVAGRLAEQGLPSPQRALSAVLATKATAVWVGFRAGSLDSVLVAKGDERALDPDVWAAGPPRVFVRRPSTEPGLVWFERVGTKVARPVPTRLLLLATGVLAVISAAEVDAVERVVRQGPDQGRLRPREDAVLSFAVRGRMLSRELSPRLPELAPILTRTTDAEGYVDLVGGEVHGEIVLTFASSADADASQAELERLVLDLRRQKSPRVVALARGAAVGRASSDSIRLRLVLSGDAARAVLGEVATVDEQRQPDPKGKGEGQR